MVNNLVIFLIFNIAISYSLPVAILPILECTNVLQNGICVTYWGYQSMETETIDIPIGDDPLNPNYFEPDPKNKGQPESFQPGTHNLIFHTIKNCSDETLLRWNLASGQATALPIHSCPMDIDFFVSIGSCCTSEFNCIENVIQEQCNGTFAVNATCSEMTECIQPSTSMSTSASTSTSETGTTTSSIPSTSSSSEPVTSSSTSYSSSESTSTSASTSTSISTSMSTSASTSTTEQPSSNSNSAFTNNPVLPPASTEESSTQNKSSSSNLPLLIGLPLILFFAGLYVTVFMFSGYNQRVSRRTRKRHFQ